MERIIEVGQRYVDVSDKSRDAAAYMLARFMTRPDVKRKKLPEFLDWCLTNLKTADSKSPPPSKNLSQILTLTVITSAERLKKLECCDVIAVSDATMGGMLMSSGVMTTLALLFKLGKRDDLLEYGSCTKI